MRRCWRRTLSAACQALVGLLGLEGLYGGIWLEVSEQRYLEESAPPPPPSPPSQASAAFVVVTTVSPPHTAAATVSAVAAAVAAAAAAALIVTASAASGGKFTGTVAVACLSRVDFHGGYFLAEICKESYEFVGTLSRPSWLRNY